MTTIRGNRHSKNAENRPVEAAVNYGVSLETEKTSQKPKERSTQSQKLRCAQTKCILRMTNVFVVLREEFLQIYPGMPRYQVDTEDKDCFWRLAANHFNNHDLDEINYNLFRAFDTYSEKLGMLDPSCRHEYGVTETKVKVEFRYVRSAFMKAMYNFRKSGMGEKEDENVNPKKQYNQAIICIFDVATCAYLNYIVVP